MTDGKHLIFSIFWGLYTYEYIIVSILIQITHFIRGPQIYNPELGRYFLKNNQVPNDSEKFCFCHSNSVAFV